MLFFCPQSQVGLNRIREVSMEYSQDSCNNRAHSHILFCFFIYLFIRRFIQLFLLRFPFFFLSFICWLVVREAGNVMCFTICFPSPTCAMCKLKNWFTYNFCLPRSTIFFSLLSFKCSVNGIWCVLYTVLVTTTKKKKS